MNYSRIFTLLLVLLVAGCAGPRVVTNNTAFYVDAYAPRGSISVAAAEAGTNNSLEFTAYKKKFEAQLVKAGYRIEDDPDKADFIALVAYGIDNGETATVSTPIFGQVGWGTAFSSRTIRTSDGSVKRIRTSYIMPSYGVIGSSTGSVTVYNRAIALDIVEANSFKQGNPEKVYEGRTKSIGRCPVFVEVFDELLEAMFSDFPGENGRNRKQVVDGVLNC